ncbi:MAG: S41 family peptidase [candidate division KSB1 bacterium]|nr:S41 family peptidase [candidate division KSB1 bacterium]
MKKRLLISLVILVVISGSLLWGLDVQGLRAFSEDLYNKIKIFTTVLDIVQRTYVEEVNPEELIEDALKGMLSNLDPHTCYLPSDLYQLWSQDFEGYSGIGIRFDIINDKITVMSVMEDGPSYRVGILPGDRIIAIEGESAIGMKRDEVPKKLMGPVGTPVTLTIEREEFKKPKDFVVMREKIVLESISQAFMIKPSIGYIKLERFTRTTSSELDAALKDLEQKGMEKLLLDLRGNSGGYFEAAVAVADKFIPGVRKIVYTAGRTQNSNKSYYSTDEGSYPLWPLIVLIDHGSASSSEIVAGAIQDWDRGLIVGQTSFGKGLVQSQFRFQDQSALLITTAKYYTPLGRLIQREYKHKTKEEYYEQAYNDSSRILAATSTRPLFKTISGRTVYGGGGITPDIEITSKEPPLSEAMRRLIFAEPRFFYTFAENYARQHPELKSEFNRFLSQFVVDDQSFQDFVKLVRESKFEFSDEAFNENKEPIKFFIKRELAYKLWDEEARFKVNILKDTQLTEALTYFPMAEELLATALPFYNKK